MNKMASKINKPNGMILQRLKINVKLTKNIILIYRYFSREHRLWILILIFVISKYLTFYKLNIIKI